MLLDTDTAPPTTAVDTGNTGAHYAVVIAGVLAAIMAIAFALLLLPAPPRLPLP